MRNPRYLAAFVFGILTCIFLYWLDDDPPYPNMLNTIFEASIITTVLTVLFACILYPFELMMRKSKR